MERRKYDRNPDTLLVLSVGTAVLTIVVLAQSPPGSLLEAWGPPWAMVWSVVTALAFLTALVGVLLRDPLMGWATELGARIVLASSLGVYCAVLLHAIEEPGSLIVAGLVLAIAASSLWRVVQLAGRLRSWERLARDAAS